MTSYYYTIKNLFPFSDQCFVEITEDKTRLFFRETEEGIRYRVDTLGNPINLDGTFLKFNVGEINFPPLTFFKYTINSRVEIIRKKNISRNLRMILNPPLLAKDRKRLKKILKRIETFDFYLLITVFVGDIPPVSLVKTNPDNTFKDVFETAYFEISINAASDISNKSNYWFSYLEIEFLLKKIYPSADINEIHSMRSELTEFLKDLGFSITRRRIPISTLPREFSTRLIDTGQRTKNQSDILSYGFCGIRSRYSIF
jgi:hypothetical protein